MKNIFLLTVIAVCISFVGTAQKRYTCIGIFRYEQTYNNKYMLVKAVNGAEITFDFDLKHKKIRQYGLGDAEGPRIYNIFKTENTSAGTRYWVRYPTSNENDEYLMGDTDYFMIKGGNVEYYADGYICIEFKIRRTTSIPAN